MHRRACLELSRRQGVDWSCATARRTDAFAPVLNHVPRRGFRAFAADSAWGSSGDSGSPRKLTPKWGSKASRPVGLSPAEQAIRDAMVAKQEEKLREEQARKDALLAREREEQERRDAIIARQRAKEQEERAQRDAIIAMQKAKKEKEQARRDAIIARQRAREQEEQARRDAPMMEQRAKELEEQGRREASEVARKAGQEARQDTRHTGSSETPSGTAQPNVPAESSKRATFTGAKFAPRFGSNATRPVGLSAAEKAARDALVVKQQAQQAQQELTPEKVADTGLSASNSSDPSSAETTEQTANIISSTSPKTSKPSSPATTTKSPKSAPRWGSSAPTSSGLTSAERAARDRMLSQRQAQLRSSTADATVSEKSDSAETGTFTIRIGGKTVVSQSLSPEEKAARDAQEAKKQAQQSPLDVLSGSSDARQARKSTSRWGMSSAKKAVRDSTLDEQSARRHGYERSRSAWQEGSSAAMAEGDHRRVRSGRYRDDHNVTISEHLQSIDWACPDCTYVCSGTEMTCPCCRAPRPELLSQPQRPLPIRKLEHKWTAPSSTRGQALGEFASRREEEKEAERAEIEAEMEAERQKRREAQDQPQKSIHDWSWDTSALQRLGKEETDDQVDKYAKRREHYRKQSKSAFADEDDFDHEDYQRRRQARQRAKKERKEKSRGKKKEALEAAPSPLYLPEFISVSNLADVIGVRHAQFIERMEEMGFEEVTHNHVLDAETAGLIAAEYNFEPIFDTAEDELTAAPEPEDKSSLPPRPPVVTIMGHVDHGKTTILDWLRNSSIVASEHGGITQHIGAFSVAMPSGKTITFLDTPGHAAFLDMRRRGADITDIVVLVVAADDSVKPQTIEAIKHATEANVPIIVAMSKMDKEGVNPDKVKQDLSVHGVHVEDYGGDVQAIGVSGKTGAGMLELEEAIVTLSEVLDHRADPTGNVEGWVVEGTTKSYGRVATVLIRRGTLRVGDIIVAGETWARVRTLRNEAGVAVHEATPGMPVEVDGWREQPVAGTEFLEATTEQQAKSVVEARIERSESDKLGQDTVAINEARKELMERRRQEEAGQAVGEEQSGPKPVHFIIKADVHGSAEALLNSVTAVGNNEVFANVLRCEVGPVSEFDIEHAATANGHVISFNMPIDPRMAQMAEARGVEIKDHNVIYRLIDDVKSTLSEHLPPTVTVRVTGEAEIGEIFEIKLKGRERMSIAGCRVRNGLINRTKKVRVLRGQETIYDGTISSLKNVKKDVTEMRKDTECGMAFEGWGDFQVGDHIQCYEEIHEKRYL